MDRMEHFTYEIIELMQVNGVVLAFNGEFDMPLINAIISSVKEKMTTVETHLPTQKKVYNIMVECLENIFRHSEILAEGNTSNLPPGAVFFLHKKDEHYLLTTGNYIQNSKVESMKSTIDSINACSTDQLKQLYRQVVTNGTFSEKGGAGLGMLDIALKSDSRLYYNFNQVNDNQSFYLFQVKIHSKISYHKN